MQSKIFVVLLVLGTLILVSCTEKPLVKNTNNISSLIGFWKLEKQYYYNFEANSWEPGLILANGTATEMVQSPTYIEIRDGGSDCPKDDLYLGQYFLLFMPEKGCFKVKGNSLELDPPENLDRAPLTLQWSFNQDKLELIVIMTDPSKQFFLTGISKDKVVASRVTKEEAIKGHVISVDDEVEFFPDEA